MSYRKSEKWKEIHFFIDRLNYSLINLILNNNNKNVK